MDGVESHSMARPARAIAIADNDTSSRTGQRIFVLEFRDITTEITAAAECDLVRKRGLTGGFGAFHGSWFSNRH